MTPETSEQTLARDRVQEKLNVPDVEEGTTLNKTVQLKKLHAVDVVEKDTLQQCVYCGALTGNGASRNVLYMFLLAPKHHNSSGKCTAAITNGGNKNETKSWCIQLQIDSKDVCFKIDT